ncbi:MAG: tetratricopeptide repeat protein [Candidatus Solibacter sp.]
MAGRASGIKEQVLGLEVFDRGHDFNPRLDPIVRVQARNLRSRMAKYYEGPGKYDPIRIELPKGTYVPIFHELNEENHGGPAMEAGVETPHIEPAGQAPAAPPLTLKASDSVMPSPPPRSPVSGKPQLRPRFMMASLILMGILVVLAVVLISRTHAASPISSVSDSQAQDLVIRGRYAMDKQTEGPLRDAVASFEQAIARAPRFAEAWAGLADAHNMLAQFGYVAPQEGMEKARDAARKSLELNPRLAEGHVALASIMEAYDWDWAGAEREFRRALALSPDLQSAHLWYGMFLRDQGRLKEAMPQLRRAAELAPYSVMACVNLAYGLLAEGNAAAALEQARRASELAPELASASVVLLRAGRAAGQGRDAEDVLIRAQVSAEGDPHGMSLVASELARLGKHEASRRLLSDIEALARVRYVSPFDRGKISIALGDGDQALNLLEEAYRQRSSGMIFLRSTSATCVRSDPRFQSLVDKMHFKG